MRTIEESVNIKERKEIQMADEIGTEKTRDSN